MLPTGLCAECFVLRRWHYSENLKRRWGKKVKRDMTLKIIPGLQSLPVLYLSYTKRLTSILHFTFPSPQS
jgi:hypothetical protein